MSDGGELGAPPPGAANAGGSLDDRVGRLDPDRWLASRFVADPVRRASVVAVYALDDELARVGPGVTQPLVGEIRLAWWRERIADMARGAAAPAQPVLRALAADISAGRLPTALMDSLVEARHADLERAPFADDAALARYLDGTAGAVMGLAARALEPAAPLRAVVEAGRAWGLASLYRARRTWTGRGRSWVPGSWAEPDESALAARVAVEVDAALGRARDELKALPVAAFPAVAYVALARSYARGRTPGELWRRARLLGAVLTGRV